MRLIVLGSGTSHGVPMIGCRCAVCTSSDPRNRRMRTSAAVRLGDETLLIDVTPELRLQALRFGIDRLCAVALTHSHADHVMGFDELRRFAEIAGRPLPVYASRATLAHIYRIYEYALTEPTPHSRWGIPVVEWNALEGPVEILGHRLTPVSVHHGTHLATAMRIDAPDGASVAWCPDCCGMSEESEEKLRGLDALFIDGLRHATHPTHFTVAQTVEMIKRLSPRRAWLIHMTHDLDHAETEAALTQGPEAPGGIRLAYDGLTVDLTR